MSNRLVTTIIIVISFFTGLLTGFLIGKKTEQNDKSYKNFLLQNEIHKIS